MIGWTRIMKILIIHYRSAPRSAQQAAGTASTSESAGTDGVSLEIAKRTELLEELGHTVAVCSAYPWADIPLPELEFEDEKALRTMRDLFDPERRSEADDRELERRFDAEKEQLLEGFRREFGAFAPDLVFVHNVLCLPIHPAATEALIDWLRETGLPCAAIHHDILNEGAYQFVPTCDRAKQLLSANYPPRLPNLRHWTINLRNQRALAKMGFEAEVIHDTLDYGKVLEDAAREKMRETLRKRWGIDRADVVLLLSTRIVPNKQAEIAGDLCRAVEEVKEQYVGRRIDEERTVSSESRVRLVLAGRPERAFLAYRDAVFSHYDELEIDWKYVGDEVFPLTDAEHFSLYPDTYTAADFALYPSRWEGFGNQFLEIVASRLPAAVFEYPVFTEDIAPLGFKIVSLGSEAGPPYGDEGLRPLSEKRLRAAAEEIWTTLTQPGRRTADIEANFRLAAESFGLPVLKSHLEGAIAWAENFRR